MGFKVKQNHGKIENHLEFQPGILLLQEQNQYALTLREYTGYSTAAGNEKNSHPPCPRAGILVDRRRPREQIDATK